MEFEKFPLKNGFDIIGDSDDDGRYSFNVHNLQISRIQPDQMMDTERFLNSTTVVTGDIYSDSGTKFRYQIRDGVMVTYHAGFMDDGWFSENTLFYVDIVNNSDHSIMFDFSKVYAVTVKNRKDGTKDIKSPVNSWERLGWDALEAINKQVMDNSAKEYLRTHPTNRPTALKSQSIKPGEAIHGFIATKKKRADSIFLYIPMGGFEFDVELKL